MSQLPTTWSEKTIAELCAIGDGNHSSRYPKKSEMVSKGVPFIRGTNLIAGNISDGNILYISKEKHQELKKGHLKKGDVLFTNRGEIGKVAIVSKKFDGANLNSQVAWLRCGDEMSPQYLFHFLQSREMRNHFSQTKSGAALQQFTISMIKAVLISLPPLPEQKRIVAILDEAFAGISQAVANAEKNLANARELFERYLQGVLFDKKWKKITLGQVCDRVEYGSSSKSKPEGKLPVLRMGNIQNGRFTWNKLVYSDNEKDNKQYFLKYNDVLFNRTNSPELVGKTAIYKGETAAIFAGYLIRIHRKEDLLDADYLNYYLNSEMALDYGKTVFISSVNQANINGTKLKTYPIPLPTLKEQQTIAKTLDELSVETRKLETICQLKLTALTELKQSLLQKAFAGELTTTPETHTKEGAIT